MNPALEAALARQKQQEKDSQVESDEAFARALQASMQQDQQTRAPPKTQEELDRLTALSLAQENGVEEQQQQSTGQQQGRRGGSSSNSNNSNCSIA